MSDPLSVLRQLTAEGERRRREELLALYLKIFLRVNEKAQAYTLGVVAVVYAAVFGVWAFVGDFLSPRLHAAAGLLLIVSAGSFVIWETWAMLRGMFNHLGFARTLANTSADNVEETMKAYDAKR